MDVQIVILAAGRGRRLGHKTLPKVLIPLKGKPVISYVLEQIKKIKQIPTPVIVVGHRNGLVRQELGSDYRYAVQQDQLGTAHAVWSAQAQITAEHILVINGDMPFISATSLKKLIDLHISQDAIVSMFTSYVPNYTGKYKLFERFGRILRNQYGDITKIHEAADATDTEKEIREVNPGIYMFRTAWLWNNIDKIGNDNAQGEFYLTDIIEVAIQEGLTVHSQTINIKETTGIDTLAQLQQAEKLSGI